MSGFDEALRREEEKQRSAEAAEQAQASQRLRKADGVAPRAKELLREFSEKLAERGVKPQRVELTKRRGLLHPAKLSPAGYVTESVYNGTHGFQDSVYLVTPDGDLWRWSAGDRDDGKIVAITAENISNDKAWIGGNYRIKSDADGRVVAYSNNYGEPIATPLEDFLAERAVRLIKESKP